MRFSVVVPLYKKGRYVKRNIERILNVDYKDYELLLVADKNYVVPKFASKKFRVIYTNLERTSAPEKRDLALIHAKGEIIVFIDDDAYPKKDWLKKADKYFKKDKSLTALGGPGIPEDSNNIKEKVAGMILSSRLGSGPFANRYSIREKCFVDEFPCFNLFIKTKFLKKIGGFNTKFYSGDDTKVALEITKKGGKILYAPDVIVYHKSRELFTPLLKQISNYALHRGYFFKKFQENSFKIWFVLPSILLFFILTFLILILLNPSFVIYFLLLFSIYLLSNFFFGAIKSRDVKMAVLFSLGVFLLHLTFAHIYL